MATAQARYDALSGKRDPYLRRARAAAKVTIPHLFPEDGTSNQDLYTPFQSIGSRGVNNLSSKLMLALFPPNSSSFKLTIDDFTLAKLSQDENIKGEVEESLSAIEQAAVTDRETSQFRPTANEAMRQLVVAGNVCMFNPDDPSLLRTFRLHQYVCVRSPSGFLLEGVIKESVSRANMSTELVAHLKEQEDRNSTLSVDPKAEKQPVAAGNPQADVALFTYIRWNAYDKKYHVLQEAAGTTIEGTEGSYVANELPYHFLRLNKVDGEDYGRGFVDDYYGDLATLEGLSEALVTGSIVMSKVVFLVRPGASLSPDDLEEVENGGFVTGDPEDVTCLQVEKLQDLSWIRQHANEIEKRLAAAFLLNSSIQRPGERVTAEEIRIMARELEDGLGGVYSVLSQELQLPLARLQLSRLEKRGTIPKLPPEVKPMIVTGIEAIGRGQDLSKLEQFLTLARNTLGEEGVRQYLDPLELLKRYGASLGISMKGLVASPETLQQDQMQQMVQAAMPNMINAGAKLATQPQPPTPEV